MKKMKMESKNRLEENIDKIMTLFPHCIKETIAEDGHPIYAIDFDALRQELEDYIIDEQKERFNITWPGKNESVVLSNSITTNVLRPMIETSEDFFNTENIYIEGNNFEVLKVLREAYLNKIDIIYIDPPYNTGRNILYKNDFSIDKENFSLINHDVDEDGNIIYMNRKSEGRFHTKWLNMMYPTLRIARDILSNNGIIILAIDDNEYANLKKICDEVFFEDNYIGTIISRSNPQGRGKKNIDPIHEYHLIYAKSKFDMPDLKILKEGYDETVYWNFIRGGSNSRKHERPYRFYPMLVKQDKVHMILESEYHEIYNKELGFNENHIKSLEEKYKKEGFKVIWPIARNGEEKVWQREFKRALKECPTYIYQGNQVKYPVSKYSTPRSIWSDDIHSNVQYGTGHLNKLFDGVDVFDYPKSIYTVRDLISSIDAEYIMDFFPGSATTAEAVMRLNALDNGERKYIMIQLPESLDENLKVLTKDEAKNILNAIELCDRLGVDRTIAEVAKERIRRASKQISEEYDDITIDFGFRVFKLDSSNMKDSFYKPSEIGQQELFDTINNIKEDRTSFDLLFQVMIELGYLLSSKIEQEKIQDNNIMIVEDELIACFDDNVAIDVFEKIAKRKPKYIVMIDKSFASDHDAINAKQIVTKESPTTEFRII
ncbi:MAG: site-specific DNA-methyltransferase [Acholeplasmataceae bacterium]